MASINIVSLLMGSSIECFGYHVVLNFVYMTASCMKFNLHLIRSKATPGQSGFFYFIIIALDANALLVALV